MRYLKEITIEVIQKCNSNCVFCSSLSNCESVNEIPIDKLFDITRFAKEKKSEIIHISGGEPFLKKDLIDFIDYNYQNGLKSHIYTSGNVEMIKFFKEYKTRNIPDEFLNIIFNYQSNDNEIFQKLIGTKMFSISDINENIKLCLKNNFNVEVHIVPNALNLESIFETSKFLKSIGVRKVSLLRLVLQGRAKDNKNILKISNMQIFKNIIERIKSDICDENFSLKTGIPFSKIADEKLTCTAGYNKLIFKYDGKVYPCEAFKEAPGSEKFILGDIYKDSLDEIWSNYYSLNNLIELKESTHNTCESCPAQLLYV